MRATFSTSIASEDPIGVLAIEEIGRMSEQMNV
jgi:hypothetical protein